MNTKNKLLVLVVSMIIITSYPIDSFGTKPTPRPEDLISDTIISPPIHTGIGIVDDTIKTKCSFKVGTVNMSSFDKLPKVDFNQQMSAAERVNLLNQFKNGLIDIYLDNKNLQADIPSEQWFINCVNETMDVILDELLSTKQNVNLAALWEKEKKAQLENLLREEINKILARIKDSSEDFRKHLSLEIQELDISSPPGNYGFSIPGPITRGSFTEYPAFERKYPIESSVKIPLNGSWRINIRGGYNVLKLTIGGKKVASETVHFNISGDFNMEIKIKREENTITFFAPKFSNLNLNLRFSANYPDRLANTLQFIENHMIYWKPSISEKLRFSINQTLFGLVGDHTFATKISTSSITKKIKDIIKNNNICAQQMISNSGQTLQVPPSHTELCQRISSSFQIPPFDGSFSSPIDPNTTYTKESLDQALTNLAVLISQPFGCSSNKSEVYDPVSCPESKFFHEGVDYKGPISAYAVAPGVAYKTNISGAGFGAGNAVIVFHNGFITVYSHLDSINEMIKNGTTVSKGYYIGAANEHLHFEIRDPSLRPVKTIAEAVHKDIKLIYPNGGEILHKDMKLIYPNGGEILEKGKTYNIKWEGTNGDYVEFMLFSNDRNTSYGAPDILGNQRLPDYSPKHLIPNTGSAEIKLRDDISPGEYKLRVSCVPKTLDDKNIANCNNNTTWYDYSDAVFSIVGATPTPAPTKDSIKVIYPNGGETLEKGKIHSVRWSGGRSSRVSITMKAEDDKRPLSGLATQAKNTGTKELMIPGEDFQSGKYKVEIREIMCKKIKGVRYSCPNDRYDLSDAGFSIVEPTTPTPAPTPAPTKDSIKVIYPNGGETLEKGKTYNIKWEGDLDTRDSLSRLNYQDLIDFELIGETREVYKMDYIRSRNEGSRAWDVGIGAGSNIKPGKYKLKICRTKDFGRNNKETCKDKPGWQDESDSYFTIVDASTIKPIDKPIDKTDRGRHCRVYNDDENYKEKKTIIKRRCINFCDYLKKDANAKCYFRGNVIKTYK